jgi:hypothetical protein
MRKMRNRNYDMMSMMRSIAGICLFSGEGTRKLEIALLHKISS